MMKFTVFALFGVSAVVAHTAENRLDGSGTTNPSRLLWEAARLLNARAVPEARVTYRAVGSSTGQLEFLGEENPLGAFTAYSDFGSGDIPIPQEDYDAVTATGRTVLHFPFLLGAMSIFHSVEGLPTSGPQGLNMTGCLLAKIFNRDITTWDDAEILDINPGLAQIIPAGQEILVYRRNRGSSTTAGVTTYLHDRCPEEWPSDQVGALIAWDEGTFGVDGSGGMEAALRSNPYAIGYLDAGHGHGAGLAEIELENIAGLFQSSLEALGNGGVQAAASTAIERGLVPTSASSSFANVSFHNQPGETSWPIVAVSYIYVDANQTADGDRGALLVAFLELLLTDDGRDLTERYGFVPIPAELTAIAENAIDSIMLPDGQQMWTFEDPGTTLPITGMGDFVVSGKRRDFYEVATSAQGDSIAELEAQVVTMDGSFQTQLDTLQSTIDALNARIRSLEADDDADDAQDTADEAFRIAVVALILALLALVSFLIFVFATADFGCCGGSSAAASAQKYEGMKESSTKDATA